MTIASSWEEFTSLCNELFIRLPQKPAEGSPIVDAASITSSPTLSPSIETEREDSQQAFEKLKEAVRKKANDAEAFLLARAKELDEARIIYLLFGALDGANLSYSTSNYLLNMDIAWLDSKPESMHEWLSSDFGMISAILTYPTFFLFSALGSYWDDKDESVVKAKVAELWPYIRDGLKATKNAYRGTANIFAAIDPKIIQSAGTGIKPSLLFPLAIVVGILSTTNRLLYRKMLSSRKDMMRANNDLLKRILVQSSISEEEARISYVSDKQDDAVKAAALGSKAIGAVFDDSYLYFGLYSLAAFSGPLFIALITCSVTYSVVNFACRLYEEYDFQRQLIHSQEEVKFALFRKAHDEKLNEITRKIREFRGSENELSQLQTERKKLIQKYIDAHAVLKEALTLSYLSSTLSGLKNGLSGQNTILGVMFSISALTLLLAGASCPPPFFLACALVGVFFLTLYVIDECQRNIEHRRQLNAAHEKFIVQLDQENISSFSLENLTKVKPLTARLAHEGWEILRVFFSGLSKGIRSIDFSISYGQVVNGHGAYEDSLPMLILIPFAAITYALVFALRAFARGYGRAPLFSAHQEASSKTVPTEESGSNNTRLDSGSAVLTVPPDIEEFTAPSAGKKASTRSAQVVSREQSSTSSVCIWATTFYGQPWVGGGSDRQHVPVTPTTNNGTTFS